MDSSTIDHHRADPINPGSSISHNVTKPSRASQQRGIPEFSDLLLACRHHLVLTCAIGMAVAFGFAAIAWSFVEPQYQAEGLVRVREQQNVIFAAQTSRAEDVAFFRSQAKLAQSPQVLAAALDEYIPSELLSEISSEDRIKWLGELVKVETESGSEVMSITVGHKSPRLAHALSNAITKAYFAEITHRMSSDHDQREQKLRQAARQADEQLDALWDELNQVAQSVGSDSAESMTLRDEMQFQAYRDHARQLQTAQLRGNQLQAQLAEQQMQLKHLAVQSDEVTELLMKQNPEVVSLEKQLSRLDLEVKQMREIAVNSDSPQMKRLTEQHDFLSEELEKLQSQLRAQIANNVRTKNRTGHQESLAELHNQIELNRSEKEFLRERLSEIDPVISRGAPKTAVPLDMSRHAVDRQSRLADSLWQSLQELRIESQSQARVTLLELSSLPKHASHSRQLKAAGAAGLAGWMLVVFMIGYLEWKNCYVRSPEDIASRSLSPLYGSASYSESSSRIGLRRAGRSGVREAAARIILQDHDCIDTPTVMVTSCTTQEPRHLVSQELAVLLADFHKRVLLVDCDTNGSQLSDGLGASRSSGMRQIAAGKDNTDDDTIAQLIVPTDQDNVDFLPAGTIQRQTSWIDPRQLRSVINSMSAEYDAIIVNGPSMMDSAESLLLAAEADTTMFSVFLDRTRWNQLVLSEEMASHSGISVGGSILHHGKANRGQSEIGLQLQVNCQRRVSSRSNERGNTIPNTKMQEDQLATEVDQLQRIDQLQQEVRRAASSIPRGNPANHSGHTTSRQPDLTTEK